MVKLVVAKLVRSKTEYNGGSVTGKRVRDASSGKYLTVRTIDGQSKTLGQDLNYVFAKNVAQARRENKAVTGATDSVPAKA